MFEVYFLIFWIPAVASAVSLYIAWSNQLLNRPLLLLGWFVVALLLQIVSLRFSPGWATGLALQTILAIYLGIRVRVG